MHNSTNYSFLAKALHWCFIIMFAYGIYKQVDDINQLEDVSLFRTEIIFASVFLLFLAFRLFYMTKTQKTSLPIDTPKSQKFAAKIVHFSMYISLAGIAGSGLLIGYFFSLGFKDGFLIGAHSGTVIGVAFKYNYNLKKKDILYLKKLSRILKSPITKYENIE